MSDQDEKSTQDVQTDATVNVTVANAAPAFVSSSTVPLGDGAIGATTTAETPPIGSFTATNVAPDGSLTGALVIEPHPALSPLQRLHEKLNTLGSFVVAETEALMAEIRSHLE